MRGMGCALSIHQKVKIRKKNEHARYGVRVIYTSKGMSKKFGVRVIYRKIGSYRNYYSIVDLTAQIIRENRCHLI
jgi:hypothetical protein